MMNFKGTLVSEFWHESRKIIHLIKLAKNNADKVYNFYDDRL